VAGQLTDCGTTPGAAATGACEMPLGAANNGAADAITGGGAAAVAGGDATPAPDVKDVGGTTGSARESAAAGDADPEAVAEPADPAGDRPPPRPEGIRPPKPPSSVSRSGRCSGAEMGRVQAPALPRVAPQ
jgi:hypothetical protein